MNKVLILSSDCQTKLCGMEQYPNAQVHLLSLRDAQRLEEYDLVVLDYAEFAASETEAETFHVQALGALKRGSMFCFLHYDEAVPARTSPFVSARGYYCTDADLAEYAIKNVGFRWLDQAKIRVLRWDRTAHGVSVARGEFAPFLDKWGASRNVFEPINGTIEHLIAGDTKDRNLATAFGLRAHKGWVLYLPFQKSATNPDDYRNGIITLLNCLLNFKAKAALDLPPWAEEPFFSEEIENAEKIKATERALQDLRAKVEPFTEAKRMMALTDYSLQSAVPKFLGQYCGLKTWCDPDDGRQEDFWILDQAGGKAAICEVKGTVKGYKRGMLHLLLGHRETRKMDDAFPAVLFTNCNVQMGSWAEKDVGIQIPEAEFAAKENALIVRIEDLVRLWDMLRLEKIESPEIFGLLTTNKGWLEVTAAHEVKLWPQGKGVQLAP